MARDGSIDKYSNQFLICTITCMGVWETYRQLLHTHFIISLAIMTVGGSKSFQVWDSFNIPNDDGLLKLSLKVLV